ncbi:MAG: hypothetical protein N2690_10230, partial [Rhodocyclaceae bacterium]|nr:hypothetical protein [Rhodocyclaceae bacterium]
MSVINQMLRDLDARQASEQERVGLPPRLRTLPERKLSHAQSLRMLLAGIGLGVLLAGVVAWLWQPAATPAPSLAPSAASPPAAQAVLPAPTAMAPATAAPDTKLADLSEMKLSLLLSLGQAAEQAASRPAAPPPASPKTKETIASPAPAAKGSHTAEASEAAGAQGQIDKRNKSGPGGELAEAEYRKGMQLVKHGEALAALPLFRHALELDPLHARARQALLSVLVGNKAWDEAKQVAAAGLALDPAQSGWAMILARLQFEQNDAAGALATLEKHAVQAANDAGNLDDLRAFTTPEMFAELKMDLAERGSAKQETDVIDLDAEVLEV